MDKLRVGIIGSGVVAQSRHIPALLKLRKKVTVKAVCDLNENLAKKVAKKFGIKHVYTKLSDMLLNEELDVVDVCTPPEVHTSVAIEAMERGCNVILEKPMATSIKECDRIIKVSRKNGVKLSVVHNQRFYPPILKAEELLNSGKIGKLTGMRIIVLTNKDVYMSHEKHWVHKLRGGVIGETGPHLVYLSLAFLNNINDVEVYAKKTLDFPWVLYDYYNLELKGDKISSSIIVSHASDYTLEEVDLIGTEGMIRTDLQSMSLINYGKKNLKPTSLALSSLNEAGQIIRSVGSNVLSYLFRKSFLGHDIFMEKFIDAILENHKVPVTPEEGRETIRVMDMIVQKICGK